MMKVLMIDNNDSFTYNVIEILKHTNREYLVVKSNELSLNIIDDFQHIIISPGPMTPACFPVLPHIIGYCEKYNRPLLGICLGHQAIGEYFGGNLIKLPKVVHGQKKIINIDNISPIYKNLPSSIEVGLYHSWTIDYDTLPHILKATGTTTEECLMSIQHREKKIFGIQFHPESFMTPCGKQIIENFLNI